MRGEGTARLKQSYVMPVIAESESSHITMPPFRRSYDEDR